MRKVSDNKYIWKTIMPNITDKALKDEKIVLAVDDEVITAETDLAKIFKDHFENIVESLYIERPCTVEFDREPVVNANKNIFLITKHIKNQRKYELFCLFLVSHSK